MPLNHFPKRVDFPYMPGTPSLAKHSFTPFQKKEIKPEKNLCIRYFEHCFRQLLTFVYTYKPVLFGPPNLGHAM